MDNTTFTARSQVPVATAISVTERPALRAAVTHDIVNTGGPNLLWEEGVARNAYSTGTYTETGDSRSTWRFALVGKTGLPWAAPGGVTVLPNIGG